MSSEKRDKNLIKLEKYRQWIQGADDEAVLEPIISQAEIDWHLDPEGDHFEKLKALKELCRFAWYLHEHRFDAPDREHKKLQYRALYAFFNAQDYQKVHETYDAVFFADEYEKARNLLHQITMQNPLANLRIGSKQGMMYSYIMNKKGKPMVAKNFLSSGTYGRIKLAASPEAELKPMVIKRQSYPFGHLATDLKKSLSASILAMNGQDGAIASALSEEELYKIFFKFSALEFDSILKEYFWLPKLQNEARFNIELGLTEDELIIVRDEQGEIYKVYQCLQYLGTPIDAYLKEHPATPEQKLKYAVDLLLLVDKFHSRSASNLMPEQIYVHGDIKPENILMDEQGKMSLIDFGFTRSSQSKASFIEKHVKENGSPLYAPISIDDNYAMNAKAWHCEPTPSYFFDDKIAALRSIYHPYIPSLSILAGVYEKLPPHLQDMLDTSNISKSIQEDDLLSLKAIAAAILFYIKNPYCTKHDLDDVLLATKLQEQLIDEYKGRGPEMTPEASISRSPEHQSAIYERLLNAFESIDSKSLEWTKKYPEFMVPWEQFKTQVEKNIDSRSNNDFDIKLSSLALYFLMKEEWDQFSFGAISAETCFENLAQTIDKFKQPLNTDIQTLEKAWDLLNVFFAIMIPDRRLATSGQSPFFERKNETSALMERLNLRLMRLKNDIDQVQNAYLSPKN